MSPSFDSIDQIKDMDLHIQRLDIAKDIERTIQHKIDSFESVRRFHRNGYIVFWGLYACMAAGFVWFLFMGRADPDIEIIAKTTALFAALSAAAFTGAREQKKKYLRHVKRGLMFALSQELNIKYNPTGFFRLGDLYDHLLLPSYDIRLVEDGFEATIGERRIQFQEARLIAKHIDIERGKWLSGYVMFQGVVATIPLNKYLDHHTLIFSRDYVTRKTAANMDPRFLPFKRVNMVSRKFQDQFKIYSTSETEGHYIFDPSFIERFLEATQPVGAKSVSASFYKDTLAIAIAFNRDLFEFGNLHTPTDTLAIKQVIDDIAIVADIVETLNMNPHIGL
ncbi:DUF3137 domain-containing protein [Micavibrio aeruginosavorus]|uniref:DUF3137 domain-containing protein n=1 Tax=Micavibrio aeruginosavorus TaxID=349221 RepID=UPI003F4AC6BE